MARFVGTLIGIPAVLVSLGVLGGPFAASAAERARIDSFSPQGTVRDLRQVKVRFSDPMVALGDPRLADPFNVECTAVGEGRWVDPRNWAYDFNTPMTAGHRCSFTLKPGLKTLAGTAMGGQAAFTFDSGGPVARWAFPNDGNRHIDGSQIFMLGFDGAPDPASLAGKSWCRIADLPERVPLDILGAADKARVAEQDFDHDYRMTSLLRGLGLQYNEQHKIVDDPRLVVARCRRALPPGAKVDLVFDAGLKAVAGLATDRAYELHFKVRPHFRVDFTCKRVNKDAACLPFEPMVLSFNSAVPTDQLMKIQLVGPDGKVHKPTPPEPAGVPQAWEARFDGPFPEFTRYRITLPGGLVDDGGRPLINADRFPLEVGTDGYPPLVKVPGTFGILERAEGGVLPVSLRGVEPDLAARDLKAFDGQVKGRGLRLADDDQAIAQWLRRVQWAERRRFKNIKGKDGKTRLREETGRKSLLAAVAGNQTTNFLLPRQERGRTTEVVGIPLKEPGFHVVELASPLLGQALLDEPVTRYVATAALVTNMAVHVHWGRESSLVWVTRLDTAQPLAGARVTVTDFCTGEHLWSGATDGEGRAMVEGTLPEPSGYRGCSSWSKSPLMISARLDGDMSFTLTDWGEGIKPWDFDLRVGSENQAGINTTVFDQTLLRAGETVHMKHFLRRHTRHGLEAPANAKSARKIEISHQGSGKKYEFSAPFDADGIGESSWAIPKDAALGFYSVSVQTDDDMRWTGSFRVEEFRLPTMKGTIQGPDTPQVNAREMPVDLFLEYLSGGGASGAPVKLRAQVEPRWPHFADHQAFAFNVEDIAPGIHDMNQSSSAASTRRARLIPLTLDDKGAARVSIPDLPVMTSPANLAVEMEYEDANGEILSVTRRIPLWHAHVLLGIRLDDWAASRDKLKFQVVALDPKGRPVAGQAVKVETFQRLRYSYRKRLIGGFYSYSDSQEVRPLAPICEGVSDERGLVHCELAPGVSGDVVLRAATSDPNGNESLSTRSVWVVGEDDWWFSGADSDRMDLLPEKPEYESGDMARFQVRMPFRQATALVTVNREGVMDSFVTHLSGKEPVISVPIKDTHAPNIFVSVLALRGRIQEERSDLPNGGAPTGLVDLRKPAFRLGLAKIRVGWKPHRLDVTVTPEHEQYQTRETARVKFKLARADGGPLPDGAELAVAAVDEALLQLKPNDSWKLLEAMMDERGLEVFTATAQTQVVGKRHYGRKAVAEGGGGGASGLQARELFETLLLWKGRVKVDANGEATLDIPLNDSLTTFRIAAIAHAGTNLYGTGSATILSSQELIIHAGLPEVVREGDRFDAMVTLRNTSDQPLAVEADAMLSGLGQMLETRSETVPPGQARRIGWTIEAPRDQDTLDWDFKVRATGGSGASDHLRISQKVIPAVPVRTLQATLAQVSGKTSIPAERPADAIPGRGGLRLSLQSSLAGSLEGVVDYMRDYPYGCLEQKVSRAIALRDPDHWLKIVDAMPLYLDGSGLMKYFPSSFADGSDVLTSYVMSIAPEAGWTLPKETEERVLHGLTLFATGKIHRHTGYRAADLTIRRLAAIAALARHGRANAKMLEVLDITPDLWPTSAVLDWITVLQKVKDVPDQAKRRQQAFHILRGRMDLHGTVLNFSTERSDYLWWLMGNGDVNANRALIAMMTEGAWREDLPLMMRGAVGRMKKGRWHTTTANAWGVMAVEKFVREFEKIPVAGTTEARYAQENTSSQWTGAGKVDAIDFTWADGQNPLTLTHRGQGKPWALVQARAAVPLKEPLFTGYRITRTLTPIEQKTDGVWTRGDVARIRLDIEGSSDMTWVVVEDPIPAGASILGSGLGGDTGRLTRDQRGMGGTWPAFQERRFDSYRAFYRFVPRGRLSLEYTIRLNNPGTFQLPPTRVEAMYAPEMMGMLPIDALEVKAGE